jgi:hypothetical protein
MSEEAVLLDRPPASMPVPMPVLEPPPDPTPEPDPPPLPSKGLLRDSRDT